MTRWLARGAFFLSGIAGLTFEILWTRHLALAMGGTTLAVAATTAAYMGGLALGSHLGGRLGDRLRRPLAWYGGLEIGIALVALVIPTVIHAVPSVDALLFSEMTSASGRAAVRFVVSALLLGLPTTAMGMTLPVLARAVTVRANDVGREVGNLYATNILGAVVGAACAGFWWIPTYGLAATGSVAVGLDLVLGIAALVIGRRLFALEVAAVSEGGSTPIFKPGARDVVGLLALTGAAAMILQVLWTRALSTALGPSTYAFSAIVCSYLLGLSLGGFAAARLADNLISKRWALGVAFAVCGLGAWFGIVIIDDLPLALREVVLDEKLTVAGLWRAEFLLAALTLMPATIAMGALFPLALSAVTHSDARLASAVGRAYAINTLGNIAGSTLAVFVVLPLLGVEKGLRLAALAYAVASLVLLWRVESLVRPRQRYLGMSLAGLAAALLILWPSWDVARWTSGLYRLSMTRAYFDDNIDTSPVVFHRDGMGSTVTVEEEDGVRWIKVDGKIDGSSEGDMPTQSLSGLLPITLHPRPRDVAVIGCGTCVTAGVVLKGPVERVTLIEIEGAVIEGAHLFENVNGAPWLDPRFRVVEDDGRNFLRRTDSRFDVIISEPSNPWMTGAASLFTQEFFTLAKSRMNEDGLFLQWLQIYELSPDRIRSVLATFQSVFPEVVVFSAQADSNDLLLVGRQTPWKLDWAVLSKRVLDMREALKAALVEDTEQLLARLLLGPTEVRKVVVGAAINTDDNALIEFGAPKDLLVFAQKDPDVAFLDEHIGKRSEIVRGIVAEPLSLGTELGLAIGYLREGMVADSVDVATDVLDRFEKSLSPPERAAAEETAMIGGLLAGDDKEIVFDAATAGSDRDYAESAQMLRKGDHAGALQRLQERAEISERGGTQALLLGYLLYRDGQYPASRRALERARRLGNLPNALAVDYYLARSSFEEGEYSQAYGHMRTYLMAKKASLNGASGQE